MRIRPSSPDELPAILELILDAFTEEPDVAVLVADLAKDPAWIPELSLVAEDSDGSLAGYILVTRALIGDAPALLLAPLAVASVRQGTGVGSALMREALDRGRETGAIAMLVLGYPDYYGRFGFRPAYPLGIEPPHPVAMKEAWMVAELVPDGLRGVIGAARLAGPLEEEQYW